MILERTQEMVDGVCEDRWGRQQDGNKDKELENQ
jgi:hypothetical protein